MKFPDGAPVSDRSFDFQDVLQLVELMKATSQFTEFKLRAGSIELELRRGPPGIASHAGTGAAADTGPTLPPRDPGTPALASAPPTVDETRRESKSLEASRAHPEGHAVVKAPMVGTVYLAPEPGAKPFVEVGQVVKAGTQICIVEVMKLLNSVTAGCDGVVAEILVGDAEAVEFGQALFVIAPS